MAILQNKTCEFGLTATYWSADVVNIYWDAGTNCTAHIELHGYRSENAKKNDLERSLVSYAYDFNQSDWIFTKGGNNEHEFYEWLLAKAQEEVAEGETKEEKYSLFETADSDV